MKCPTCETSVEATKSDIGEIYPCKACGGVFYSSWDGKKLVRLKAHGYSMFGKGFNRKVRKILKKHGGVGLGAPRRRE
jgi:Zn-finger nucleic acid-binding protein